MSKSNMNKVKSQFAKTGMPLPSGARSNTGSPSPQANTVTVEQKNTTPKVAGVTASASVPGTIR